MDFNEPAASDASIKHEAPELFDVCHVGVVLRVVLSVQVVMLLAMGFQALNAQEAFNRWSQTTVATLPASLLWLVLTCAVRRSLQRAHDRVQWMFVTGLGAIVAMLAQWELAWLTQVMTGVPVSWGWSQVPAAVTGGLMGVLCLAWLKHRARSVLPAHAAARLAELQARIRPHFLFNTLNTAIALVQLDPPRAERVLEDLSELFRQALTASQSYSTLGEEVELSRRYLSIEQLRFGDRMRVDWQVDDAVLNAALPPLILQPLVENAVRHGVEPDPAGGWITVEARAQGGGVLLNVRNSVPKQVALPLSPGQGMALQNVIQRLQLMYDVQAELVAGVKPSPNPEWSDCYEVRVSIPLCEGRLA